MRKMMSLNCTAATDDFRETLSSRKSLSMSRLAPLLSYRQIELPGAFGYLHPAGVRHSLGWGKGSLLLAEAALTL